MASKTNTEQLQEELKQTADSAVTLAKDTAETVQKGVQARAVEVKDAVQQVFYAGLGALALAEEEGSKLFKQLVQKGEKVDLKGALPSLPVPTLGQFRDQFDLSTTKVGLAVKERVGDAQYMANEAAEKVEDRVQDVAGFVMKRVGVPTRAEVSELTASVERLTQHIERMKQERTETQAELEQAEARLRAAKAEARAARTEAATPALTYEAVGGGWYELKVGDVVVEKVQGRDEAEAALARLQAQQN